MTADQSAYEWNTLCDAAEAAHDPGLEPYSSMGRDEVRNLMQEAIDAGDLARFLMLEQHYLDKLSIAELKQRNHALSLSASLMLQFRPRTLEEAQAIASAAGRLAAKMWPDG